MLRERPLERVAPVNGDAGGDAVVGETAPPDHEAQGVLQRLKPRQKAVPLDRDARAGCRGFRRWSTPCASWSGGAVSPTTASPPASPFTGADPDIGIDD